MDRQSLTDRTGESRACVVVGFAFLVGPGPFTGMSSAFRERLAFVVAVLAVFVVANRSSVAGGVSIPIFLPGLVAVNTEAGPGSAGGSVELPPFWVFLREALRVRTMCRDLSEGDGSRASRWQTLSTQVGSLGLRSMRQLHHPGLLTRISPKDSNSLW
jgi:hypothetical protein